MSSKFIEENDLDVLLSWANILASDAENIKKLVESEYTLDKSEITPNGFRKLNESLDGLPFVISRIKKELLEFN